VESILVLVVTLAVLNLPVYFLIGRHMFTDFEDFFDCVKFWLLPEWLSAFRGEYWDDLWAELRLILFVVVCGVVVAAETLVIVFVLEQYAS
jgi:hypothetical protein